MVWRTDGSRGSHVVAATASATPRGCYHRKIDTLWTASDHDATSKDTVNLARFDKAAIATNVSFTDAGTNTAHTYDLYQGTGVHANVVVAVEHDLTVTVAP